MIPFHIWALLIGFGLDLLIGDPEWFPHPVRLIGAFIRRLEAVFRARVKHLRRAAPLLTLATTLLSMGTSALLLWSLSLLGKWPLLIGMSFMSWTCLSTKNLAEEANGVAHALGRSLPEGRRQVARIVGRDVAGLSEREIICATVETVAENTVDGVISPMLYLAIGGPLLGMGFKAASTLDSMVGYLDAKYKDIGWFSAKLDDLLNYLPARIGGLLMCVVAALCGLDGQRAFMVMMRDHKNHKSPNCAWPESVASGALGIKLGGTHRYFGKLVEKPGIGDDLRAPEIGDIGKANRLLYGSALLMLLMILGGAYAWVR